MNPLHGPAREQMLFLGLIVALSILLFAVALGWRGGRQGKIWRAIRRAGRHRRASVLAVGVFSILLSLVTFKISGNPVPVVEDEHAYLLAADTFAHGRLTNPPSPFWRHFETPHVIQQPTYMAKYPPGQGLALAMGQIVFGLPIVGAWICIAIACAAICWFLQGCVPPHWAMIGGFLSAMHPAVMHWASNYWGGGVAMMGGALLFGSVVRSARKPTVRDGAVLGIAIAILAASRPFEGAILTFLALAWLAMCTIRSGRLGIVIRRIAIGAAIPIALAITGLLIYQRTVTGDALRMPYQVYLSAYSNTPLFLWQKPSPRPHYDQFSLERFQRGEFLYYQNQLSLKGWIKTAASKVYELAYVFVFCTPMEMAFIIGACGSRHLRMLRFAIAILLLFLLLLLLQTYFLQAHYASAGFALMMLIGIGGMRFAATFNRHRGTGRVVVCGMILLCLLWLAPVLYGIELFYRDPAVGVRDNLIHKLAQQGGQHLVFVRETPQMQGSSWVFNLSDLDHSPVIFAHEMDTTSNQGLIAHYPGAKVWLVTLDPTPSRATPYDGVAVP